MIVTPWGAASRKSTHAFQVRQVYRQRRMSGEGKEAKEEKKQIKAGSAILPFYLQNPGSLARVAVLQL